MVISKGAFGTQTGQDKADGTGQDGTGRIVLYCVWKVWDRTVDCTVMRLVWLGQNGTRSSNDQSTPLIYITTYIIILYINI